VLNNRVLRIFGLRELTYEAGENGIISSQVKEIEMGRAFNMHGREEKCTQGFEITRNT
jgi:hypothetical protein